MRITTFALACLLLPAASWAGMAIEINPERLNGEDFTFFDDNEGINNQLEFDVEGPEIGFEGQVFAVAGPDNVSIFYATGFPNQTSADRQNAAASQDTQVLMVVAVNFLDPETPDYNGQAAPLDCSASAKIRDNNAADPDSPDSSQASLSCDLGKELDELDPPPGSLALAALQLAFEGRKDVRLDTDKGKLSIKHKGAPPEL